MQFFPPAFCCKAVWFRKPQSRIPGGYLLSMGLNPVFFIVFCPMAFDYIRAVAALLFFAGGAVYNREKYKKYLPC
jgi:hypothetical protein